jgi:hypothetical protein
MVKVKVRLGWVKLGYKSQKWVKNLTCHHQTLHRTEKVDWQRCLNPRREAQSDFEKYPYISYVFAN